LDEHEDANETKRWVEEAGRKAVLMPGDVASPEHCRSIFAKSLQEFGGVDILVNNAAHQASFKAIEDITDEEWDITFRTNIHSMFYLTKAAVPHMKEGGAIINTASINADIPNPTLLAYATTKGAIQNFTAGLAQLLAEKGIRANAVAPGPIWTPLIPSTMPEESVKNFGKSVPMKRPGQPADDLRNVSRPSIELCVGIHRRCDRGEADPLTHCPFGRRQFLRLAGARNRRWRPSLYCWQSD
jgi:NAD(P)-dependent dehydrogenase (short-subunit alcohol dehydrogenase family)